MMTATMVPPPTTPPKAPAGDTRFVSVRANLLPEEIISARQTEVVRKQVLIGLVVVVILLVGWFCLSWWQTRSANGNLDAAEQRGVTLQQQQNEFAPLVKAQGEITDVQTQLQSLMVGDLPWTTMLTTLRSKAPTGVFLTEVKGDITTGAAPRAPVPDASILNSSGKQSVGSVTVTGTAPDKRTVAAYADALGKVPGLASPLIQSVLANGHVVTFSVSVVITADALGGRYPAPTTPSTTGGN